jgi:YidC/Oxa1 family membrane protein insertase
VIGPLAAAIAGLSHLAATNPLSPAFQALLDFLGAVLAFFYRLVPNYGVAIILLTLAIRVLLLPLAVKQIRSMQAMQAVQPKVKELQKKYKGNRQKLNEEMMALYREHGVNPLSGCFPLLAQFPVLIALFAVLRVPGGTAHIPHRTIPPSPANSRLYNDIVNQHTKFLGANLLCSAQQAGRGSIQVVLKKGEVSPIKALDCGKGVPTRIPYYVFAVLMIGTTYYQQRQMQRASPAGAQQQQALTKIMPLLFGFWGFIFPAGLVVYWTTTNAVQIGQQYLMFSRGVIGGRPASNAEGPPPAAPRGRGGRDTGATRRGLAAGTGSSGPGGGRRTGQGNRPGAGGGDRRAGGKGGNGRPGGSRQAGDGRASGGRTGTAGRTGSASPTGNAGRGGKPGPGQRKPGSSDGPGISGGTGEGPSGATPAGGSDARDRKKRRKR